MKSVQQFFLETLDAEGPKFVRVLKAVPPDQAGYRPHQRSSSAGDIIWLLATELGDACELVEKGSATFTTQPAQPVPQAIALYEKNLHDLKTRLAAVDEAQWERPAKFLVDGKVVWEAPLGDMLCGFLFDAIHHRGQLSSYLRPMGAKVPSIYGPSGDDPGN
jgi:hypothetical protein